MEKLNLYVDKEKKKKKRKKKKDKAEKRFRFIETKLSGQLGVNEIKTIETDVWTERHNDRLLQRYTHTDRQTGRQTD